MQLYKLGNQTQHVGAGPYGAGPVSRKPGSVKLKISGFRDTALPTAYPALSQIGVCGVNGIGEESSVDGIQESPQPS